MNAKTEDRDTERMDEKYMKKNIPEWPFAFFCFLTSFFISFFHSVGTECGKLVQKEQKVLFIPWKHKDDIEQELGMPSAIWWEENIILTMD